jgi:hypothetical protein
MLDFEHGQRRSLLQGMEMPLKLFQELGSGAYSGRFTFGLRFMGGI